MDHSEQRHLDRAERLALARRLASEWGYWCIYGNWGERAGRKPREAIGTLDRRYRAPPMYHPPQPSMPEANENVGLEVQRAFIALAERQRAVLQAEFHVRPWVIATHDGEPLQKAALHARVSVGAYQKSLEWALLALLNVMKRKGYKTP